jgi:hypothetical protein
MDNFKFNSKEVEDIKDTKMLCVLISRSLDIYSATRAAAMGAFYYVDMPIMVNLSVPDDGIDNIKKLLSTANIPECESLVICIFGLNITPIDVLSLFKMYNDKGMECTVQIFIDDKNDKRRCLSVYDDDWISEFKSYYGDCENTDVEIEQYTTHIFEKDGINTLLLMNGNVFMHIGVINEFNFTIKNLSANSTNRFSEYLYFNPYFKIWLHELKMRDTGEFMDNVLDMMKMDGQKLIDLSISFGAKMYRDMYKSLHESLNKNEIPNPEIITIRDDLFLFDENGKLIPPDILDKEYLKNMAAIDICDKLAHIFGENAFMEIKQLLIDAGVLNSNDKDENDIDKDEGIKYSSMNDLYEQLNLSVEKES